MLLTLSISIISFIGETLCILFLVDDPGKGKVTSMVLWRLLRIKFTTRVCWRLLIKALTSRVWRSLFREILTISSWWRFVTKQKVLTIRAWWRLSRSNMLFLERLTIMVWRWLGLLKAILTRFRRPCKKWAPYGWKNSSPQIKIYWYLKTRLKKLSWS